MDPIKKEAREMKHRLLGKCMTTAMGIMLHTNLDDAMKLALKMDIAY